MAKKNIKKTSGVSKDSVKKAAAKKPLKDNDGIKKDERISEILKKKPEAGYIMMKHGIHCVGCHAAMYETLEQGAQMHGMSDKEIESMIKEINLDKKK
jgi:hybrid cluster-associated redox disulfide protein